MKEPKKTWKFDSEFHLKAIHKIFLQMWYAVLLPELYYRNLWASVTARVWGKLPHCVPRENGILLSSCTLEALFSQTVRLIKSSQFGVEILSHFFSQRTTHKCICENLKCFISNLILSGSRANSYRPRGTPAPRLWISLMRLLHVGYLCDHAAGHLLPAQTPKADIHRKWSGRLCVCCVSAVYRLYDQLFAACKDVQLIVFVQQVQSHFPPASYFRCSLFGSMTDPVCCCIFHCLGLRCCYCLITSVCSLDLVSLQQDQTWNLRSASGSRGSSVDGSDHKVSGLWRQTQRGIENMHN